MKQLIRRLSRIGDSSQREGLLAPRASHKGQRRCSSDDEDGGGCRAEVPEGHVPVYVGDEMERFVVRADLLSRPPFLELLRRSAEEYGYEQRGVLRIPCAVPLFQRVLHLLLLARTTAVAPEEAPLAEDPHRWSPEDMALPMPVPSSSRLVGFGCPCFFPSRFSARALDGGSCTE